MINQIFFRAMEASLNHNLLSAPQFQLSIVKVRTHAVSQREKACGALL